MKFGNRQSGLTLLEVLITTGLMAVILGLGVPSMSKYIDNSRAAAATNELIASINEARAEAIKNNKTAIVQARSGGWDNGYRVGVDLNGDNRIRNADDQIIYETRDNKAIAVKGRGRLIIRPSGRVARARDFSITPENCEAGEFVRNVSVSVTGSISSTKEECGSATS